MLGVCLGHQAMGKVYGGDVIRAEPVHGKRSSVEHTGVGVFTGLPPRSRRGGTTPWRSLARPCPRCSR